jgi:sensor c-di-GMP phosphodiesterase-like protein
MKIKPLCEQSKEMDGLLTLSTVAEGVETIEQMEQLRE